MKQVIFLFALVIGMTGALFLDASASKTVRFVSVINPGVLATDVRDGDGKSIVDPQVELGPVANTDVCRSDETALNGKFGEEDERIYVDNPKSANGGWTLTVAPAKGGTTA